MPAPRDKTVESLGLTLHYLEWGEPDGEPLMLVHGFLDLAYSWQPFVAALLASAKRRLRILAPDCRGHGFFSVPPSMLRVAGGSGPVPCECRRQECAKTELSALAGC